MRPLLSHVRAIAIAVASITSITVVVADRPQDPQRDRSIREIADTFPRTRDLLEHLHSTRQKRYPRIAAELTSLTRVSETDAAAFVTEHHPELANVLDTLRTTNRRAYRRAMRDVTREVGRLRIMERRNPTMFPLALEKWKNGSRIRLLAARIALSDQPDPEAEAALRRLVRLSVAADRRVTEFRTARLRAALDRAEQRLNQDVESAIDGEMEKIRRRIERRRTR